MSICSFPSFFPPSILIVPIENNWFIKRYLAMSPIGLQYPKTVKTYKCIQNLVLYNTH